MPAVGNLIQETSVSTGTGNLTISGLSARQRFSDVFSTGGADTFDYFITHDSLDEWERGTGSLSSANILVRDTVIESSNAGSAVNFTAGGLTIVNDVPAAKQVQTDLAQTLTNKTIALGSNTVSGTIAQLQTAVTDATLLTTADEGSGNGIDADTVDGSHASAFASASHNHAAGDVTSGTFADARIAESNVTQHQAAITGLGTVTTGNVDAAVSAATTSLAGKLEIATAAEIYAGTANKAITSDAIDGALEATPASLSSTAASIAINLDSHFIFTHTTTENTTLANPTNGTIGQIYRLDVTQGATARIMNLGGQYRYVGGAWPGLTAIATALDRLWILKTGASSYDVKLDANVNNAS